MLWVYLSPHFDDAAYSCGGLIWEQTRAGERVEIWTVCAGAPPPGQLSPFAAAIHARWGTGPQAVRERREEDQEACQILGASPRLFDIPDCIYRFLPDGSPLIVNNEDLFSASLEREAGLVDGLAAQLRSRLPARAQLVAPLTLGNHVDHRLVRAAAQALGVPLRYYADFPYAAREDPDLERHLRPGWRAWERPITAAGLEAWQRAVAAYRSQASTFWVDDAALRADMEQYWRSTGGLGRLWGPPVGAAS
jgi:LmbE family N-acetylglucosaminyl deacetylase